MIQSGSSSIARRTGFTLVELLIAVAIMAVLATMVLMAMWGAQENARDARTRTTINKLHTILMDKWESYQTRRVPVEMPTNPMPAAKRRLDALRELMRMEMPDRWSDIADGPTPNGLGTVMPALWQAYNRRYDSTQHSNLYQNAETLYLIVLLGASDETGGIEQFRPSEIGDIDGDGAPEFIDGWGQPIRFLRWAPAFVSELQNGQQPDPFDPTNVEKQISGVNSYALFPLIYSAGPDGRYGILSDLDISGRNLRYSEINNNPFFESNDWPIRSSIGRPENLDEDGSGVTPGDPSDHLDNIHNHLLTVQ